MLQAKHFLETGEDRTCLQDLLPHLDPEDRAILEGRERAALLPSPEAPEFRRLSEELIAWASRLIRGYGA